MRQTVSLSYGLQCVMRPPCREDVNGLTVTHWTAWPAMGRSVLQASRSLATQRCGHLPVRVQCHCQLLFVAPRRGGMAASTVSSTIWACFDGTTMSWSAFRKSANMSKGCQAGASWQASWGGWLDRAVHRVMTDGRTDIQTTGNGRLLSA